MTLTNRILVISIFFYLLLVPCLGFSQDIPSDLKDGLYAQFDTNKGQIIAALYYKFPSLLLILQDLPREKLLPVDRLLRN